MEQQIITLTQVFRDLNRVANNSLFYFDGEKVTPSSSRVKLIFFDNFFKYENKFCSSHLLKVPKEELARNIENDFEDFPKSFVFVHNPTRYNGGERKHSADAAIVEFSRKFSDDTKICIQQDDAKPLPRRSFLLSTEQLGHLICMLYFREKGYIVQTPLGTYGKTNGSGVDDVIAWSSPVVNKLREFRFIGKGCHISELACLRWLGRETTLFTGPVNEEIILVEVEPYETRATGSSKDSGVQQLYRAADEQIAKKLFISFPFKSEDAGKIFEEIKNSGEAPTIGAILFNNKGVHINDSEVFPDKMSPPVIQKYEKYLKKEVLLNNFYFEEILQMIRELNLDTKNKGFDEVVQGFYKKIEEIPVDYVLEKLNDLI